MNKFLSPILAVALVMPQTAKPVSHDFIAKCACAVAVFVAVSWYATVRSVDSDKKRINPSAGMSTAEREAFGIGGAVIVGALGYVATKAIMDEYTPQSRLSHAQRVRHDLESQALARRTPHELAQRHSGAYPLVSVYFEVEAARLRAQNALSSIDKALCDEPENLSLLDNKAFFTEELLALGQLSSQVINTPEYEAQRLLQLKEEQVRRARYLAQQARRDALAARHDARWARREAERARYEAEQARCARCRCGVGHYCS